MTGDSSDVSTERSGESESNGESAVLQSELAELRSKNERLEEDNACLLRGIAPWEKKFHAGVAILVGAAFLVFHMATVIVMSDKINGWQFGGITVLAVAMAAVVWGFFWYTINLKGR